MQGPIIFITEFPCIFRLADHQALQSPIFTLISEAVYLLHSVYVSVGHGEHQASLGPISTLIYIYYTVSHYL